MNVTSLGNSSSVSLANASSSRLSSNSAPGTELSSVFDSKLMGTILFLAGLIQAINSEATKNDAESIEKADTAPKCDVISPPFTAPIAVMTDHVTETSVLAVTASSGSTSEGSSALSPGSKKAENRSEEHTSE